ncbi:MAG: YkgJ family cysteine cluster protein [Candidatus Omnitrophica bacterium]|jgi:Fe-S-cluster containining protein|nr:YkgJ family cysteine cluster protein [Candidatus Omnitrophota bacterium]
MKRRNKKIKEVVLCHKCRNQSDCCSLGAWIDLEEAKKIVSAGIRGEFFHLEKDDIFPSGYKVGTSFEEESCSFLEPNGLCRIHKIRYDLKPVTCKEFPYEDGKLAPIAHSLCTVLKAKKKRKMKKR